MAEEQPTNDNPGKFSEAEEARILLEVERRFHEVKDQLQSHAIKRRNEAIVLTVGLISVVTTILNLAGKQAIQAQVDSVIGENVKDEMVSSLSEAQTKLENIRQIETKAQQRLSEFEKEFGLKWRNLNSVLYHEYYCRVDSLS